MSIITKTITLYKCDKCGYEDVNESGLKRHEKIDHVFRQELIDLFNIHRYDVVIINNMNFVVDKVVEYPFSFDVKSCSSNDLYGMYYMISGIDTPTIKEFEIISLYEAGKRGIIFEFPTILKGRLPEGKFTEYRNGLSDYFIGRNGEIIEIIWDMLDALYLGERYESQ